MSKGNGKRNNPRYYTASHRLHDVIVEREQYPKIKVKVKGMNDCEVHNGVCK